MNRNYYETPKPSKLMRLFWKAAGADQYILERSTYSDQIKYTCMGGVVVATGVMAALAGGYAFYTIFEPKGSALDSILLKEHNWESLKNITEEAKKVIKGERLNYIDYSTAFIATIFGLIWGLIIFNIDRFIVTSTGKGDGTEAITAKEFKGAIPRIIMGMIIALTISKPVEIRMFKTEIDVELAKMQDSVKNEHIAIKNRQTELNIKIEKEKIDKLSTETSKKYESFKKLQERYLNECQGMGSSQGRGCGPIAESIKQQMTTDSTEYFSINSVNLPLIDTARSHIIYYEAERANNIIEAEKVAGGLDGLLMRLKIVHRPDMAGGWISIFITLLFMAIELTPIFFKLMLIKGPYDFMDENIKELKKAENAIEIQHDYYKDKEGQQRDLIINHQSIKLLNEKSKLLAAQTELNEYAINKWKEEQKKKIDSNLDDYIKGEE